MGKKFLTIKEVAAVLNVNEALVYRLVNEGKIGAYRLGTSLRISQSELKALLGQKKIMPLYPVTQASGVLKLSKITLYSLIKRGKIKALNFGRVIRLSSIFGFSLNQQFLSIKELGKLLKVNSRTVRRLILGNKIDSLKLGSQYRIPESICLNLTKQAELKPLLSVNETAKILGRSRLTVINYINRGELEAVRLGRVYRLTEETVKNYKKRFVGTYSVAEFARILRVSPSLIRKLVKEKDIEVTKINGEFRFGKEEFDQFLTSIRLDGSMKKKRRLIK